MNASMEVKLHRTILIYTYICPRNNGEYCTIVYCDLNSYVDFLLKQEVRDAPCQNAWLVSTRAKSLPRYTVRHTESIKVSRYIDSEGNKPSRLKVLRSIKVS